MTFSVLYQFFFILQLGIVFFQSVVLMLQRLERGTKLLFPFELQLSLTNPFLQRGDRFLERSVFIRLFVKVNRLFVDLVLIIGNM
jgi:hypothetical protein